MRKIFSIVLILFALLFGAESILAVDNDYKNSLLKIEINEKSPNDYNIGLYTKKIYNEPIKVIRKSDTIYYFLLPETNHAITSTPNGGAIKNILVKTYPYAGQDMNNGYTKVAIITTKPINLSTSLKTLDASVSPRLDPIRLARLDSVFERYSERLAQNNIPTPLSEFRKTASIQTPSIKSSVDITNKDQPVKIASANSAKSFEEYQNQKQHAQKNQTAVTKQAVPVQQVVPAKQAIQTKQAAPKKQSMPVKQPVQTTLGKQTTAAKPIAQDQIKQPSKPAETQKQVVNKEVIAQTASKQPEQKTILASLPKVNTKQISPEQVSSRTHIDTNEKENIDEVKVNEAQKASSKGDGKLNLTPKEISERIKPVIIDKPVDMKFEQKEEDAQENIETEKSADNNETLASDVQDEQDKTKSGFPIYKLIPHIALLMLLGGLYIIAKIYKNKKNEAIASERMYAQASMPNIKETLQKKSEVQNVSSNKMVEPQYQETAQNIYMEPTFSNDEVQNSNYNQEYTQSEVENAETYVADTDNADENAIAFNEYMNNVQEVQDIEAESEQEQLEYSDNTDEKEIGIEETLQNDSDEESEFIAAFEDNSKDEFEENLKANDEFSSGDEVINQLYTPIETPVYEEENEPVSYEEYTNTTNQIMEESVDDSEDVATIVSSSKLTETRGLYLAKFGGATSLVGYIQDDIYVLYNFGEGEIKDTEIQSTLAQENATDSLYLVKTGGKKLMVKSTPYQMSLEMVM